MEKNIFPSWAVAVTLSQNQTEPLSERDRQTDRQTDRRTDRQTDRQIGRQTEEGGTKRFGKNLGKYFYLGLDLRKNLPK